MSRGNRMIGRIFRATSAAWKSRSVFAMKSGSTTTKLYLLLLVMLSSIFTGCIDDPVQSLTPFYTEEAVIEFPQLEGEWLAFLVFEDDTVGQMNMKPWIFEDSTIKIFDENRKISVAQTRLFQIEDSYFADIVMTNFDLDDADFEDENFLSGDMNFTMFALWSMSHWRPVHVVYKVQIDQDNTSLALTPLSFNWLARILKKSPNLIPLIEQSGVSTPVANATSEAWMSFLEKYRHEEKAFPSDQMLTVLLKKCGNSHVLQSYKNGSPQVAVFPVDRELSDGIQARANTPIYYAENGRVVGLMLNRDWQAPAGFWLKAGTWVVYFENGNLNHATLAQDWKSPKGKLMKAGTVLEFSKAGKIKKTSSE